MQTAEVTVLTERALAKLLTERQEVRSKHSRKCRRQTVRWPFPGTVQLWVPDDEVGEALILATSLDLSVKGLAVRCEEPLEVGIEVTLAVHEPEVSFQGRAVVRHCTENDDGLYCIGMAFIFDK